MVFDPITTVSTEGVTRLLHTIGRSGTEGKQWLRERQMWTSCYRKLKISRIYQLLSFVPGKSLERPQIFWGSLNIGQKMKRVWTDWGCHSSQSERRGWASSILFGGQQTPADPSHSVPSGTHTKWRNEWAGKVGSTGGMVKTDEGAKMACTKIKNKQSSHWQTDGS